MKRSEMIEILFNSYAKYSGEHCIPQDEQIYSNILKDLEIAGMLPPEYFKDPFNVNDWEPEDVS